MVLKVLSAWWDWSTQQRCDNESWQVKMMRQSQYASLCKAHRNIAVRLCHDLNIVINISSNFNFTWRSSKEDSSWSTSSDFWAKTFLHFISDREASKKNFLADDPSIKHKQQRRSKPILAFPSPDSVLLITKHPVLHPAHSSSSSSCVCSTHPSSCDARGLWESLERFLAYSSSIFILKQKHKTRNKKLGCRLLPGSGERHKCALLEWKKPHFRLQKVLQRLKPNSSCSCDITEHFQRHRFPSQLQPGNGKTRHARISSLPWRFL